MTTTPPDASGQHDPFRPPGSPPPPFFGAPPTTPIPTDPGRPDGPLTPPPAPSTARGGRRRWLEIGTVALVGGLIGSAATQVSMGNNAPTSSTYSYSASGPVTARPVVQANPVAPDWTATASAVAPSVVAISVGSGTRTIGQGSGVIIDAAGHVLTNNHVVSAGGRASNVTLTVTLDDRRTYQASVTGTDPASDLAVIKLTNPPSDLRPIALGNDDNLRVGDPVMAVGNPLGLAGTVTTGIVSALNRPVSTTEDSTDPFTTTQAEPVVTNAIQTSAAINPGNSGGALVDGSGLLVGINSSIASTSGSGGGNIGIGFAIPVNHARSVADQLIKGGTVKRAYLGVYLENGTVQDGSAKRAAAIITEVSAGTPGAKAGLQPKDAVVAINGEPLDSRLSLIAQIRERNVNDVVTLTIIRDGQRRDVQVTLAERPANG